MPFTLYVDEFQNFVVSSFEKILSEAAKAGLSLVMANQFLEQLPDALATAIRSNVGTPISFRVSAPSGRALEGELGGLFGAGVLTDLERGRAVARLGRAGDSFLLHTFPPVDPTALGSLRQGAQSIREQTHRRLCRPRGEVEAELRIADESLQVLLEAEGSGKTQPGKTQPGEKKPRSESAKPQTARSSVTPAEGAILDEPDHIVQQADPQSTLAERKRSTTTPGSSGSIFFGLPDQLDEEES